MSKNVLIVESDPSVVENVRVQLTRRGLTLDHTADGKACMEKVRQERPAAVIIAVELPNGQNGYLLCREIKKDDELKAVPVIIVGNPEKFADHKKLRTRADEYLAKPLQLDELLAVLEPLVGGFEATGGEEEAGSESLNLTELMDDAVVEEPAEEISVDASDASDADLSLLDAAPGENAGENAGEHDASHDEAMDLLSEEPAATHADDALNALGGDDGFSIDEEAASGEAHGPYGAEALEPAQTQDGQVEEISAYELASPEEVHAQAAAILDDTGLTGEGALEDGGAELAATEEPEPPPPVPLRTGASADAAELRSLRARNSELKDELERAETRATEAEDRLATLEAEASQRPTATKSDKDYFALREAANKKDKDILRLKSELHEKEQAELELREREVQLEQQVHEHAEELSKKDAQLKTLTSRVDALQNDKKKADSQSSSLKDEARAATERLQAAEDELAQTAARATQAEVELNDERALRGQLEEELSTLRVRVTEHESDLGKHEERVAKLYARIQDESERRDRVKKAIEIATQLLHEQTPEEPGAPLPDDGSGDEPRAA